MAFPSSDYPADYDAQQDRTDDVDFAYAADFDFQDEQLRRLQSYLGKTGKLIGEDIAASGPSGLISAVADGGEAIKLAVREAFTSGSILTVGDDFDVSYQEKLRLNADGRLWTADGADFVDGSLLRIPTGGTLPAPTESALFYKTGIDAGFYASNGALWSPFAGSIAAATDASFSLAMGASYIQDAVPVAGMVGGGVFDGSWVASGQDLRLRAFWDPQMTTGTSYVRLYDVGTAATPAVPTLITEFSTVTSGQQAESQDLTVSASGPSTDTVKNEARLYEVRLYQSGTQGDTIYLHSLVLNLEVASLPTGELLTLFDVWAFGGM